MIALIFLNIYILIKFRKEIKFKNLIITVYFFTCLLLSKDVLQWVFSYTSMVTLTIFEFMKSNIAKLIAIILVTIIATFFILLFFAFSILFLVICLLLSGNYNIIYGTHYYCEKNYEIYAYSSGALGIAHYNIGKHYEFLDIDGIIYIYYSERNEVSEKDYYNFLKNYECRLVSDNYGS